MVKKWLDEMHIKVLPDAFASGKINYSNIIFPKQADLWKVKGSPTMGFQDR